MRKLNFIKKCMVASLIAGSVFIQGCEKSESAADTDGNTTVLIKVVDKARIQASTTLPKIKSYQMEVQSDKNDDVPMQVTAESSVEEGITPNQPKLISSTNRSSAGGLKASTNAAKGAKYRMMIYYKDSGLFYKSMMMNADEMAKVELPSHNTFNWIAYTYNDDSELEVPSDLDNPKIESLIDRPLLYASGEIEVEGGQASIDIQFKYLQAQVVVELNSTQMYGTVVSVKAKFDKTDYIKNATLNLKTGKFEDVQSSNISDLTFHTDVDGKTKYTSYYTIEPERLTNMGVIFSEIQVKLDETGEIRSGLTNAGVPQLVNFEFVNPASFKTLRARLMVTGGYYLVRGIKWSPGYLYIHSDGSYRFRSEQKYLGYYDCDFYWNWKSTTPRGRTGSGDPCAKVYPEGNWRLPTYAEISKMAGTYLSSGSNFVAYPDERTTNRYMYLMEHGIMSGYYCNATCTGYGKIWSSTQKSSCAAYILEIEASCRKAWVTHLSTSYRLPVRCVRNN
ncbi:hypothetical protein [Sphingobacterium sp.]|uniref:hypothetical protein n=1 Tax=Sphingobacterium sp. TaxID=341027 RepID=UPI0028991B5C|nr:hypothetical protein [Sphingobacterium sp.]